MRPDVDVLIPTAGRTAELAVTLAGLVAQEGVRFRVVVSDQSDERPMLAAPAVMSMVRVLRSRGRAVILRRHRPKAGMAEHRASLLAAADAPLVLFLDDDVWLEPGQLPTLVDAIGALGCGAVGAAVQGLSFLHDVRPGEQAPFAPWVDGVEPERLRIGAPGTERWTLHNAANLTHIAASTPLPERGWLPYRVAWLSGCVLFRREALQAVGGFDFWPSLPPHHSGEDVVAVWKVMERFGAAGILPSGAVHLESPTTLPRRDADAARLAF